MKGITKEIWLVAIRRKSTSIFFNDKEKKKEEEEKVIIVFYDQLNSRKTDLDLIIFLR